MVKGEKNNSNPQQQTIDMYYNKITKKKKVSRRLFPKSDSGTDLNELYNKTIEDFEKKWNFDVKNGKPEEGNLEWSPIERKN